MITAILEQGSGPEFHVTLLKWSFGPFNLSL